MKKPFETIVTEHGDTVLRVCRAVVGRHDADDAWAETFLAALRAYPALSEEANVEAWLVTIAHRKSIDIVRSQRRRALTVDEVPDRPTESATGVGERRDLWDAVWALPLKQRQAVAYHYLAGLPYADVASVVGGSADAARRAAADGVGTLRTSYANPLSTGGTR